MPEGEPRGDGDNDEDDKTDMGDDDKDGEMKESADIGSYHKQLQGMKTDDWTKEVNKHIGGDKALGFTRKAAEHEILRKKFGADAHKKYMGESTQLNEGPGQSTYARVATDRAEEASKRANSYGGQDYHLHMIAHHSHALAAKSDRKSTRLTPVTATSRMPSSA